MGGFAFADNVTNVTYDSVMPYFYSATDPFGSVAGTGETFPDTPAGCITYLNSFLPTEERGPGSARYSAEKSATAGVRGQRPVNAKKLSGKKPKALDESYNQWLISRNTPSKSVYEQLSVQGMESGRPTLSAYKGHFTST